MTAIIYHRVDWDGYTSAAVALCAFPQADLIGWNYRDPLPDISKYDRVIVVDLTVYSTNPDGSRDFSWMFDNQKKLIWIDHHPIIHEVPGTYAGIQEEGIGACWLTWKYFHDEYGISCNTSHIKYAATFDVFRKDGWLCTWEDAWAYQLFLNKKFEKERELAMKINDTTILVDIARKLIAASEEECEENLHYGYGREDERALEEAEIFTKCAHRMRIGKYLGWLIESDKQPAMVVKSHSDRGVGDFFILWAQTKRNVDSDGNLRISVRTAESSDFSSRQFAEKHLGGGHEKAAGCTISPVDLAAYLQGVSFMEVTMLDF